MKVVIAGSRHLGGDGVYRTLCDAAADFARLYGAVSEVVSGGARGVDAAGLEWARACGLPVRLFLPDWNAHGRAAGPVRNREMAAYGDGLILLWDGKSRGSRSMLEAMQALGKPTHEVLISGG